MNLLNTKEYWDSEWDEIFDHYQQDTRFAHYINAILKNDEIKILELAAGSFRDMALLNTWNKHCTGIDFSSESIKKARTLLHSIKDRIVEASAFDIPFEANHFDFSYHNGFWGCFDSHEDRLNLAKEQARVTRGRMAVAVHNKHNEQFVEYFNQLKKDNTIYEIRFFDTEEIFDIMETVCDNLVLIPVGKRKLYYEDYLIKIGIGNSDNIRKCFEYHGTDLLTESERLICIGNVKR